MPTIAVPFEIDLPESVETRSEEATVDLGRRIASALPKRAVILLIGNLGAGKTTLAKGIVSGLGAAVIEEVASPTFTLIHEYGGGPGIARTTGARKTRVYHIDLYRLDRAAEVATLGLDEIFEQEAVVLIEWGERFPELMPTPRIEIRLEPVVESVAGDPAGNLTGDVPNDMPDLPGDASGEVKPGPDEAVFSAGAGSQEVAPEAGQRRRITISHVAG